MTANRMSNFIWHVVQQDSTNGCYGHLNILLFQHKVIETRELLLCGSSIISQYHIVHWPQAVIMSSRQTTATGHFFLDIISLLGCN